LIDEATTKGLRYEAAEGLRKASQRTTKKTLITLCKGIYMRPQRHGLELIVPASKPRTES